MILVTQIPDRIVVNIKNYQKAEDSDFTKSKFKKSKLYYFSISLAITSF